MDDCEIDVLVGPISITSGRLAMPGVDFTQPYYMGKSGVLLPMHPPSILSRVQVFFGWAVISSVLVRSGPGAGGQPDLAGGTEPQQ